MSKETGRQQFCVTRKCEQVPSFSPLETLSVGVSLVAIRIVESLPYFNLKSDETFQAIK